MISSLFVIRNVELKVKAKYSNIPQKHAKIAQ